MVNLIIFIGKTECSVSLSKDGWSWFVCGRQLVIWKYSKSAANTVSSTPSRKSIAISSPKSHELTLPPSDLAHKSDLVAVFCSEPDSVPSCIAVSPEGTVRYWDSIAHENFFVEINADLQVNLKRKNTLDLLIPRNLFPPGTRVWCSEWSNAFGLSCSHHNR